MADTCKNCKLVHTPDVLCVHAQGVAMRSLLEKIGERAECRGCGAEIFFVRHTNGKSVPYTPAGLNHFVDCPVARQFFRKGKL